MELLPSVVKPANGPVRAHAMLEKGKAAQGGRREPPLWHDGPGGQQERRVWREDGGPPALVELNGVWRAPAYGLSSPDCIAGGDKMHRGRQWLIAATLASSLTVSGCGQLFDTPESREQAATKEVADAYEATHTPLDDATHTRAVAAVGAIPESVGIDVRFRCTLETMVVADMAKTNAQKPSFNGHRMSNDPFVAKLANDRIFLSDEAVPDVDLDAAYLKAHVTQYEAPGDDEASFNYAVWYAGFIGKMLRTFGLTALESPESKGWLNKGRSQAPSDVLFRRRAGLTLGEKQCYDLIHADLQAAKHDPKLDGRLLEAVGRKAS
jgi:hypothetical protein